MPKLSDERELIVVSLRLYKEDWEALDDLVTPTLKKNALIRRIINTYVVRAKDRIRAAIDAADARSAAE
jgi:hypothetical protein